MNHESVTVQSRRGALLLIVMLMLALFMAIGAFLLTITVRAKSAAKALEALQSASAANETLLREALDTALLAAIRGATANAAGTVVTGAAMENMLHDKYGSPILATGSALAGTQTAVITLSLAEFKPAISSPSRLNGRLLTIKPRAPDADVATFRILGATGSPADGITCFLANGPAAAPRRFPVGAFDVVINGREFTPASDGVTPEAYDAYHDTSDMWLAQPILDYDGQVVDFNRMSFLGEAGGGASAPTVDNDNDGVLDGAWIPTVMGTKASPTTRFVLPDRPSVLGGTIRFQVSYLILDLDGRININTAGISARDPAGYAASTAPSDVPLGMGYGPADVDASLLFPATFPESGAFAVSGTTSVASLTGTVSSPLAAGGFERISGNPLKWPTLLLGGTTLTGTSSAPFQRRPPWGIGPVSGRYGLNGVPGTLTDDGGYLQTTGSTSYSTVIAGANTVADLQGRKKLYMDGPAGSSTLVYFSPTEPSAAPDWINDPYEARLNGHQSDDDAPFMLAELERVLRANDADAQQLPQRLAAGLGDSVQLSRTTITTESWDTPGLTGEAARKVENYLAELTPPLSYLGSNAWTDGASVTNPISPDVAAGLRFNINRPVLSGTTPEAIAEQQDYCKGLFTLAVALGAPADATTAQWAANALDFRDTDAAMTRFKYDTNPKDGWQTGGANAVWGIERPELVISSMKADGEVTLLRPMWKSEIRSTSGTSTTDLIDPALAGSGPVATLGLDITRLSGTSSDSIWRLKPDVGSAISGNSLTPPEQFNNIQSGSTARHTFSDATSVELQRLADPTRAYHEETNPYVTVSEIKKTETKTFASNRYHWPNRPFISHAELAFVPSSDAKEFFPGAPPTKSLVGGETAISHLLLDATLVPSRFAGTGIEATGAALTNLGLDRVQPYSLSNWREPGRVNVNTIVSGPTDALGPYALYYDDVVWTTLIGGTHIPLTTGTVTNIPFAGQPRTRTRSAIPGKGGDVPTIPARPGKKAVSANPAKSTGHLLSLRAPEGKALAKEDLVDARKEHPYFAYARAIRLANTATVRSNVFAIWITVKIEDDSANASSPMTKRLFAIVDRSIPVGYSPGQNLNVRDCIRLVRFLD